MCNCKKDTLIQEYQNQTMLDYPFKNGKKVCIDTCILEEIKILWNMGIKTTGCCCGHNYMMPFIGVAEESIDKMIELDYIIHINPNGKDNILRKDSFFPKSIQIKRKMYDNYFEHLYKNIG